MMKTGAKGRSLTIVIVVFELFFAFMHRLSTLDEPDKNVALKHLFSIIPFSCYQMIIGSLYYNGVDEQLRIGWHNLNEPMLKYPMWMGLMWLLVDLAAYTALFLVCNACNPRLFGTPPIKWSELFQLSAWKRVFLGEDYEGRLAGGNGKLIDVSGLQKTYFGTKDVEVFEGADFYINEGEVIVIIGPNGAGKSTLVNILSGAVEPNGGTLRFHGQPPTSRFKVIQRTLGVVYQENIIWEKLSVREHLELFGTFKGISPQNLEEAIDFFAGNLQLSHMLNTYAGDLSGGQKRKLCIAISLLGNPPIVIMDEPTAGVDVQARQLIWKTIASLSNTTSIITSHALEEAETVSSRLFIVADRQIPFCGTSTELRNEYQCGYLLRVDREDHTVGPVLALAKAFIPSSHLTEDREDTIRLPVDRAVSRFLKAMISRKDELGILSYSFAVEQLEDMLLKMIETGESLARKVGEKKGGEKKVLMPDSDSDTREKRRQAGIQKPGAKKGAGNPKTKRRDESSETETESETSEARPRTGHKNKGKSVDPRTRKGKRKQESSSESESSEEASDEDESETSTTSEETESSSEESASASGYEDSSDVDEVSTSSE
jgi:ABC-type multidrug transport system ATPase subunit